MPHRVLVVDDEEAIRDLLQEYLEGRGYRVVVAWDGEEGIEVFKRSRAQLAIVDFLLPKKNGFAVADAIRHSDAPDVPIIMMSGVFKNPKTAVEAREKYQVVDFLSKPLDLERLGQTVDQLLEGVPAYAHIEPPTDTEGQEVPARHASLILENSEGLEPNTSPTDAALMVPSGSVNGRRRAASVAAGEIVNGVFHGRPFPELPEQGPLESMPVALLLSTVRYDRGTGMLDMNNESGTHRRIYIIDGNPTFMQSNAEGENVGALLLSRGRITEPDFDRCLRYMKDKGRTLQQSLLELRLVTEPDLATAYKLLAGQLLPLALGMPSGTYQWRVSDAFVGRVPEGQFEPVQVLFQGIKKHVHPPQILKFFKGREDIPLVPTTEFQTQMKYFRRVFGAKTIAESIDGHRTYRQLNRANAAEPAQIVPQLFALVTSGMTVLPEVNSDNALEIAVNQAAAGIDLEKALEVNLGYGSSGAGAADAAAQSMVEHFYIDVMSKDFFKIFDATADTPLDEIKSAYFELAKRWHSDAFSDRNLGPAKEKLELIFARITEAYETITDPGQRSEYIVYLDRKARGLPTDINEILRGEQLFDQAAAMIRRQDFVNAKQVLEEATRLNPDPIYFATLGWVVFNLDPNSPSGLSNSVRLLKKAIQEQENLPVAYQYMGNIAFARGNASEAQRWWQRCLQWEPGNAEAARGLRALASRGVSSSPPMKNGLIDKMFKK
ncbi:MAG: response regulator [Myxococcota bacterium]